jgi:hypothetical protein
MSDILAPPYLIRFLIVTGIDANDFLQALFCTLADVLQYENTKFLGYVYRPCSIALEPT